MLFRRTGFQNRFSVNFPVLILSDVLERSNHSWRAVGGIGWADIFGWAGGSFSGSMGQGSG